MLVWTDPGKLYPVFVLSYYTITGGGFILTLYLSFLLTLSKKAKKHISQNVERVFTRKPQTCNPGIASELDNWLKCAVLMNK